MGGGQYATMSEFMEAVALESGAVFDSRTGEMVSTAPFRNSVDLLADSTIEQYANDLRDSISPLQRRSTSQARRVAAVGGFFAGVKLGGAVASPLAATGVGAIGTGVFALGTGIAMAGMAAMGADVLEQAIFEYGEGPRAAGLTEDQFRDAVQRGQIDRTEVLNSLATRLYGRQYRDLSVSEKAGLLGSLQRSGTALAGLISSNPAESVNDIMLNQLGIARQGMIGELVGRPALSTLESRERSPVENALLGVSAQELETFLNAGDLLRGQSDPLAALSNAAASGTNSEVLAAGVRAVMGDRTGSAREAFLRELRSERPDLYRAVQGSELLNSPASEQSQVARLLVERSRDGDTRALRENVRENLSLNQMIAFQSIQEERSGEMVQLLREANSTALTDVLVTGGILSRSGGSRGRMTTAEFESLSDKDRQSILSEAAAAIRETRPNDAAVQRQLEIVQSLWSDRDNTTRLMDFSLGSVRDDGSLDIARLGAAASNDPFFSTLARATTRRGRTQAQRAADARRALTSVAGSEERAAELFGNILPENERGSSTAEVLSALVNRITAGDRGVIGELVKRTSSTLASGLQAEQDQRSQQTLMRDLAKAVQGGEVKVRVVGATGGSGEGTDPTTAGRESDPPPTVPAQRAAQSGRGRGAQR